MVRQKREHSGVASQGIGAAIPPGGREAIAGQSPGRWWLPPPPAVEGQSARNAAIDQTRGFAEAAGIPAGLKKGTPPAGAAVRGALASRSLAGRSECLRV